MERSVVASNGEARDGWHRGRGGPALGHVGGQRASTGARRRRPLWDSAEVGAVVAEAARMVAALGSRVGCSPR
jgi:hypothetical protein